MGSKSVAVAALVGALLSPFLGTAAQASGDDYPYRTDTSRGADPWGFTKRQCVSFAAWELKQAGHPISNAKNAWGNGEHWDEAAKAHHFRLGVTPAIGAIAQWNANEKSAYYAPNGAKGTFQGASTGHVAVVIKTYADKSALVEQYNVNGKRAYSTMHIKAPRYLYIR